MAGDRRRASLVAVLLFAALAPEARAQSAPSGPNPIAAENALPGDAGWRLRQRAGPGRLEGYAGATSVNHGEAIDVHLRADAARTARWTLHRMGWYGGAGGRLVAAGGPVSVGPQPTPAPTETGLIECRWPVSFTIPTDPAWTSGVYLAAITRDDGPQTYVVFVVRADERKGAAVVQLSVTTWQAYNAWGGKSLYTGGPAQEVSFDRPYLEGNGAGQYFRWEHFFVLWAESRGLDLTYVTNVDVDRDPALLAGQRLFLSVGHDEYWSRPARAALEGALAAGTSAAFFSANAIYWQIRLEPSKGSGEPRRTLVCYKGRPEDPLRGTPLETVRWREAPVSEPENGLLGVMYSAWLLADGAFVVRNASHWIYEGTGVRDGDSIPGIVGYETDRRYDNGRTPPGTEVLARSPVVVVTGRPDWHEATIRATPAGGFVFASGTIEWAWGLSHPSLADRRVQRVTENVLRRAGLVPETPEPPALQPQSVEIRADDVESLSTVAGTPFAEGLRDGPVAETLFRRPSAAAVDAAGNVFVADTGNHAVRLVRADAARTVSTIAGDGTAGFALGVGTATRLTLPQGIAVGPDGTVLVADTGNHRIVRLRPGAGGYAAEPVAGADGRNGHVDGRGTAARFTSPAGLVLAGGALYVADRGNNAVRRIDAAGDVTTVTGGGWSGMADGARDAARFFFPTDLSLAGGALLVVDAGNRAIRRVSLADGSVSTVAGPTAGGYEAGGFADGAAADARFMSAGGILADGGDVLIADAGNARLRRLRDGAVATVAGTGVFGSTDGPAAQARLAAPSDVERLGPGEWLVVDQGASALRRMSARPGAAPPEPEPTPAPAQEEPGRSGGCGTAGGAGALALAAGLGLARGLRRRAGRR
jgi:sugar lactone lactonase YvrE